MTREEQIYKKAEGDCIAMLESIERGDIIKGSICPQSYRAGFMDGAKWADQHPNWIPVQEELPPENGKTQQSISVWATNGLMSGEFRYNFDTKMWTDMWGDPFDITHWMLLPQLPRKEGNK